jgi:hypothetical protein
MEGSISKWRAVYSKSRAVSAIDLPPSVANTAATSLYRKQMQGSI